MLANPVGPPVRGWENVSARLDLAASNYRDGRDYESESIATVITPELAYTVEIERIRTRVSRSSRARRQTSSALTPSREVQLRFPGTGRRDSHQETRRRNVDTPVEPGKTYRRVFVATRISTVCWKRTGSTKGPPGAQPWVT
jgi:hypothetical protein